MRRPERILMARRHGVAVATLALLAGCAGNGQWFQPLPEEESQAPPPAGVEVYLDTLQRLSSGDEASRDALYQEIARDYRRSPTTTNRLRFALVLVMPGHPASDPSEGARILEDMLESPKSMLPLERSLAEVQLSVARKFEELTKENRQLAARARQIDRRRRREMSDELQMMAAENDRLRAELAEAKAKLEAIRTIERAILSEAR